MSLDRHANLFSSQPSLMHLDFHISFFSSFHLSLSLFLYLLLFLSLFLFSAFLLLCNPISCILLILCLYLNEYFFSSLSLSCSHYAFLSISLVLRFCYLVLSFLSFLLQSFIYRSKVLSCFFALRKTYVHKFPFLLVNVFFIPFSSVFLHPNSHCCSTGHKLT